jgi:hypothetical protein
MTTGPLSRADALRELTPEALRWRIKSGQWQQPCCGVAVPHSGPLDDTERLLTAVLWAGKDAALAGLTAAIHYGLKGFSEETIHLLVPAELHIGKPPPSFPLTVHRSRTFRLADVHPVREPRQTRIARSLVDAAAWMPTGRGAQTILAAGVQQRLAPVADLAGMATRNPRLHRRGLILSTLNDIAGGSEALSELDFLRLVVRAHGLPEPTRQYEYRDSGGKRRRLDAVWEDAKIVVEIDGSFHMDADQWRDDMERENELKLAGYLVLRFTSADVRTRPRYVAAVISRGLRRVCGTFPGS